MKKTAAAILSLLLMTGAVAGMADGAYTPGTYTVSADGNNGAITLRVEMTADAIADIMVFGRIAGANAAANQ